MDPTMAPTFEINFRAYQEILDACRPFYALDCEGKRQDCYEISVEQNIPPRLEDGLQKKTQSKAMPNDSESQHAFKVRSWNLCTLLFSFAGNSAIALAYICGLIRFVGIIQYTQDERPITPRLTLDFYSQ